MRDFFSIPRDVLEGFALQTIQETITNPILVNSIEDHLRRLLNINSDTRSEKDSLKDALHETETKIQNLLKLAENASVQSEAILKRLNELEQEKQRIESRIAQLTVAAGSVGLADVGKSVAEFLLNFEQKFKEAPMHERKVLVKQCISRIVIEKENKIARFYVRRIPAVVPVLEELYRKEDLALRSVMSTNSARNRT